MKRKICVVTGSRSEYGLLKPLMLEIQKSEKFQLQLIASAMHLSPEFGETIQEILHDGFTIDHKVEMLLSSDSAVGVTKSMGLGVIGYADAYDRLSPDLIVLLGDRFEALAAAQAAMIAKIPVAHIHGGELTEGAFDDGIRHSITKMSHYHFTAAESYRKRVIQLGEDPNKVFAVGPMVESAIKHYHFLTQDELENSLNIRLRKTNFLVTYLPETLGQVQESDNLAILFSALNAFPDVGIIFTKANADPEGRKINALIDKFCETDPNRIHVFTHLGQLRYLSLMKLCQAVIGNSSSGIIEAPLMKVPTVNIGDRQTGRERKDSIIDCVCDNASIQYAIKKALSFECVKHPAALQEPAEKIMNQLDRVDFPIATRKSFFDWEFHYE